jgi:hypothetical protein
LVESEDRAIKREVDVADQNFQFGSCPDHQKTSHFHQDISDSAEIDTVRALVASSAVLVEAIPVVIVAGLNTNSRTVASDTAGASFIGAHCAVALGYSEFSILEF